MSRDIEAGTLVPFRFMGKDVPRVELPLKVTGAAKYAIGAQAPAWSTARCRSRHIRAGRRQWTTREHVRCRASPTS
jgi:hypothetical protein